MGFKKTLLFFGLFLLVAIPFYIFVVLLPVGEFNRIHSQAPSMVSDLIDKTYPADLVITIKNGEVSLNQKTPYCLIVDSKTKVGILFDEKANPTDFVNSENATYPNSCKPFALVGKNFVVYPDTESNTKGAYKIQTISQSVNYKITKDEISKFAIGLLPKLLNIATFAYYIGPFVLALLVLLTFLLRNLWYATVAMLTIKWTKIKAAITFNEAYSKSFFVFFVYSVFDMVIVQFFIKYLLHLDLSFSFPFLTTILVTVGTVLLEKYYFAKQLPVSVNTPPAAPEAPPTPGGNPQTNNQPKG